MRKAIASTSTVIGIIVLALACIATWAIPAQGAVVHTGKIWTKGQIVTVKFVDGTDIEKNVTVDASSGLSAESGVSLIFVGKNQQGMIRISFDPQYGCSGMIGTDNLYANQSQPTITLGCYDHSSLDDLYRVARHEWGHAFGLLHEHQHPDNPYSPYYDYTSLSKINSWTEDIARRVYGPLPDEEGVCTTSYDYYSIMHYPVPNAPINYAFSDLDFYAIRRAYQGNLCP